MEPTQEELENMRFARDVCDWAELDNVGEGDANPRLSFLKLLGATEDTKVFLLGGIPEQTWADAMTRWKIGDETPTAIQLASAGYVGIAARLKVGATPTRAQKEAKALKEHERVIAQAKAASGPSHSPASGMIKMSTIVDQGSDREVAPLAEDKVEAYYAIYRKQMGHNPRPEEDITMEQLSGLKALFASGAAPYVDLSIWGPYGHRTQRKLKLSGLVLGPDGVLQPIQIYGPPNFESYAAGFAVFRTGCIMLEEITLSTLALWQDTILKYSSRYGPSVWTLIYQTEVRARSELLTRTKRAGFMALNQAKAAGGTHPYNPDKPWDWVFREAAADIVFWREELEEKALLILAKISKPLDGVEGDAPTSQQPVPKKTRELERAGAAPPPKRASRDYERVHRANPDGTLTHNRRGVKLCEDFQVHKCGATGRNGECPRDPTLRHQCSKCLMTGHGAADCRSQPAIDNTYKKGKGKSGGKGKGKRHF